MYWFLFYNKTKLTFQTPLVFLMGGRSVCNGHHLWVFLRFSCISLEPSLIPYLGVNVNHLTEIKFFMTAIFQSPFHFFHLFFKRNCILVTILYTGLSNYSKHFILWDMANKTWENRNFKFLVSKTTSKFWEDNNKFGILLNLRYD